MAVAVTWTPELDACVSAALNVEGLSYSKAGQRFDISKDALIGRARRQGYAPQRGSPLKPPHGNIPAREQTPAKLPIFGSGACPIGDSHERGKAPPREQAPATLPTGPCAYPIGDPREPGFHSCGAPSLPGRPYCETHFRLCYQPQRAA